MTVIHIHCTSPQNPFWIDIKRITVMDMVVNKGSQKVVCSTDGVKIASEVQIDVFHRKHLGIAAARRPAFDAEYRAERRFAQGDNSFFTDTVERIRQTNGDCCFPFSGRRRADSGYQNKLAPFFR